MKALVWYAGASAVLVGVLAVAVAAAVGAADAAAVWLAAAVAWPVQVLGFGALLAGRAGPGFMAGWGGGMLLRFAVVGGMALWVTRTEAFDAATALLSLVGFVFVLVLLEPLFLRMAD